MSVYIVYYNRKDSRQPEEIVEDNRRANGFDLGLISVGLAPVIGRKSLVRPLLEEKPLLDGKLVVREGAIKDS